MKKNNLKKMIRIGISVMVLLTMVMSLSACGLFKKKETAAKLTAMDEEVPFGEFSTTTISGQETTQDIFSYSNLTMVNIWGTFCNPCIEEMPDLGALAGEYDQQDFQIIGLICDVTQAQDETALGIIDETGANYEHIVASETLNNNVLQFVQGVPTTIFVNKDGMKVGDIYLGGRNKEEWKGIVEDLIAQQ